MAEVLKGAPAAATLTEELAERTARLRVAGVVPTLAILRVGARPDDLAYEKSAIKRCEKVGVAVRQILLTADCPRVELLAAIRKINADGAIHGCLMFRPLPDREAEAAACALLAPEKDVDGMTSGSLAAVFSGQGAGYPPCTAESCMELLRSGGLSLCGKRAVVIGRSLVIGRPVSMLLQRADATVTMCHTKTENLPGVCREADILIACAGKAEMVDDTFVRPGQTVVDVGIHTTADGRPCGDVDFAKVAPIVSAITPVPGGVGAVTTAVLCRHVVEAAERCGR